MGPVFDSRLMHPPLGIPRQQPHHLFSISGLVVKSIVAIDGPRVRFTANAFFSPFCRLYLPVYVQAAGRSSLWLCGAGSTMSYALLPGGICSPKFNRRDGVVWADERCVTLILVIRTLPWGLDVCVFGQLRVMRSSGSTAFCFCFCFCYSRIRGSAEVRFCDDLIR
ncbi:hypothetical protein F4802DRAFT_291793 [Xylaria palmicola]|nr:hypothetical protein F4802DRAFT_291793 [Xylaria palmicola]